jgi:hypothetical protein
LEGNAVEVTSSADVIHHLRTTRFVFLIPNS